MSITKENFHFLNQLKDNNNRDWFEMNKKTYQKYHLETCQFAEDVLSEMRKHDQIETASGKKSLYRIYRDTRFSKDKTPYKTHWGGILKRATKANRGSYYFHIEPGNSFIAGGFWGPNGDDMKRIRAEFDIDGSELREILASENFQQHFGTLLGKQVKTAPRGFDKDHKNIDLLRYKQFLVKKDVTDKEVLSENYHQQVAETFMAMRPFFDYMSDVLTTDLNGESIL